MLLHGFHGMQPANCAVGGLRSTVPAAYQTMRGFLQNSYITGLGMGARPMQQPAWWPSKPSLHICVAECGGLACRRKACLAVM